MKISFSPFVIIALLFALFFPTLAGCAYDYHGNATVGIRYGTEIAVFQTVTPDETGAVDAKTAANYDGLFGWIKALWIDTPEATKEPAAEVVP